MKYLNVKKALVAWQELQPLSEKDRERREPSVNGGSHRIQEGGSAKKTHVAV